METVWKEKKMPFSVVSSRSCSTSTFKTLIRMTTCRSIAGYTFSTGPYYATLRNVYSSIWRIDGILRKDPLIRRGTPGFLYNRWSINLSYSCFLHTATKPEMNSRSNLLGCIVNNSPFASRKTPDKNCRLCTVTELGGISCDHTFIFLLRIDARPLLKKASNDALKCTRVILVLAHRKPSAQLTYLIFTSEWTLLIRGRFLLLEEMKW